MSCTCIKTIDRVELTGLLLTILFFGNSEACLDLFETGQVVVRPGQDVFREDAAGSQGGSDRLLDMDRWAFGTGSLHVKVSNTALKCFVTL